LEAAKVAGDLERTATVLKGRFGVRNKCGVSQCPTGLNITDRKNRTLGDSTGKSYS
jgi:hypothetical protein